MRLVLSGLVSSKRFIFLSGFLSFVLISVVDFLTGDFYFAIFYLIPVAFVTWFAGKRAGLLTSLVSTWAVFALDVIETPQTSHYLVHYWNAAIFFISCALAVYFLSLLKKNITDLVAANEKVNQYAQEAQRALKIKTDFTSMVSHEIRNPMMAIREGANIILGGLTGEINVEQKDLLRTIINSSDRLIRLVSNVLDFQKVESYKIKLDLKPYDINDVVREIHKTMGTLARHKGLAFEVDLDSSVTPILFDRDEIVQVLTNLVSNAVKFTDQGLIKIKTLREKNAIHVTVLDTGPGIRNEDIQELFQSFHRLDSTRKKKIEGTGLGLAICKEIVMRHNGKIWGESEIGKGSAFHFILPVEERRSQDL